jgi:SAM-dependent methyltransferase
MDGLIYAYRSLPSVAQQKYMQERRAELADQRKRQGHTDGLLLLEPTYSGVSATPAQYHRRTNSSDATSTERDMVEHPRTSSSTSSSQSEIAHNSLLNNPFELRHGRRYLRELPYPLPVDLHEIQRQNLRTLLCCRVFGRAVCSPEIDKRPPKRVLEIGCGSGYWSAMCHEYLSTRGHRNVAFTGMDVAPLAPDLKRQGVNWTFVQHDLRRIPLPFDDEQFDLVMLKDLSLVLPLGMASERFIDECIRILAPTGILEIWESDHVLRSLMPHPPAPTKNPAEQRAAANTATYLLSPGTPFAAAQNKYLQQANAWIQEALDRRKLPPTPCARIAPILYQEPDALGNIGARRVAIPLGELRWERDGSMYAQGPTSPHDSVFQMKGKARVADADASRLTADQSALRHVALLTVVQMIENLEPLLKETSGKNSEEWSHWWASMMTDLMDPGKTNLTGECLEVGAWWATRLEDDS